MNLASDLNCFTPAFPEFDPGNIFGSDPGYDEAFGPHRSGGFVPIDDVDEDQGDGCLAVRQYESSEERDRRLFWVDPDEPLGHGETLNMVREQLAAKTTLRIDTDYEPPHVPAKVAVRLFNGADMLPAKSGIVNATIKKFDRRLKKWIPFHCSVQVSVRRAKWKYEPVQH